MRRIVTAYRRTRELIEIIRKAKSTTGGTPRASSDGRGDRDVADHALRLRLRDVPPRTFGRSQRVSTLVAAVAMAIVVLAGNARGERRLIGQDDAGRLGLTRAWFTQVQLSAAHTHVERAVLEGDRLTVLTSAGVVQELDALT